MSRRIVFIVSAAAIAAIAVLWIGALPSMALADPVASFAFSPSDPSIVDVVQFTDTSSEQTAIQSWAWDFGDGATSAAPSPNHQYAADGDYTVHLTVAYAGGTSQSTQVVQVRSHDVAVTKLMAPKSANTGQTRSIAVGIGNRRYSETVQVELYKSVPGGYLLVGTLTQTVPAASGNRTTDFKFAYTFVAADASAGTVTFKAVATIQGARDCVSVDNLVIASPTKVK